MNRAFLADGWRIKHGRWLVLPIVLASVFVFNVHVFGSSPLARIISEAIGTLGVGFAFFLALGLARRQKPIVEVSDDVVHYRSIHWPWIQKSVQFRNITSTSLKGVRVELATRSGEAVDFRLGDLSRKSREAVRSVIEERIRT